MVLHSYVIDFCEVSNTTVGYETVTPTHTQAGALDRRHLVNVHSKKYIPKQRYILKSLYSDRFENDGSKALAKHWRPSLLLYLLAVNCCGSNSSTSPPAWSYTPSFGSCYRCSLFYHHPRMHFESQTPPHPHCWEFSKLDVKPILSCLTDVQTSKFTNFRLSWIGEDGSQMKYYWRNRRKSVRHSTKMLTELFEIQIPESHYKILAVWMW